MNAEYYFMRDSGNRRAIRLQAVWPTAMNDMFPFIAPELNLLNLKDAGFGDKKMDIIWTCENAMIVGPEVCKLIKEYNISGIKLTATSIILRNNVRLLEYYGLSVIGDIIRFDFSRSKELTKRYSERGAPTTVKRGVWFYSGWCPGCDIIKSELGVMASERVVRIFSEQQITGVIFVPQSQEEVNIAALAMRFESS